MRVEQAAPVLLSSDVARTAAWFRDALGWECELFHDPPDFGIAKRDETRIMFALCETPERIVPNWRIVEKMWNVYVRVDDVDALYAEILERGVEVDYSLYDAPHGMREFGLTDPDGHDIAFGRPLAA